MNMYEKIKEMNLLDLAVHHLAFVATVMTAYDIPIPEKMLSGESIKDLMISLTDDIEDIKRSLSEEIKEDK